MRLKEYSFVVTLNEIIINRIAMIEPLVIGRCVTIEASLSQNPVSFFQSEPTFGIYGQNDLTTKEHEKCRE